MLRNKECNRDDFQMSYQSMSGDFSNMSGSCCVNACNVCPPICECPQNQVCHRIINYEVPQE